MTDEKLNCFVELLQSEKISFQVDDTTAYMSDASIFQSHFITETPSVKFKADSLQALKATGLGL